MYYFCLYLMNAVLALTTFSSNDLLYLSDALPVQWWLADCESYNQHETDGVHHRCFHQPFQCSDTIVTQFTDDSGASFSIQALDEDGVELFSDEFNKDGKIYTYSFVPSVFDICDEKIQLKIIDETSPESVAAFSDALDIKSAQEKTTLITYYNSNRNFAGLQYADVSPDITFYARIPSIFFHQRAVTQQTVVETSSMVVNTSGTFKWQKTLETGYIPYYMHKKLALILKHQFIEIEDKDWLLEESYEIIEGDRRWPLKKARVILTDKNSITRNIL